MFYLPTEDLEHIWKKANRCLPELMNAKIFMTGATGFFGQWLLESVHYANHFFDTKIEVLALTRSASGFIKKSPHLAQALWLNFLEGDVRHFSFPQNEFTHVIHAATDASAALNQANPMLMLDTTFLGTRRVLEFAKQAQVKSFLLTSSGAVYGKQPDDIENITESYTDAENPIEQNSAYGMGKLAAEYLSLLYFQQYKLPVKIARCFAFVGPHLPLDTHFAIGNFISNALNQEQISIAGDGSPYRSYLYAADLMIWLWTILCHGTSGRSYNVGSDQAINIADLAQLVAVSVTPSLAVNIAQIKNPNVSAQRYVPSTERAKQELDLDLWVDLPTAIHRTINWNRSSR
ncbi:MAG: NAD(P)-dependent oxidoreductase [Gammaproteobacteria bacterium]|nr:NAD(P)-dependent oxidoreductase [Gammaproteobacteria bacterium]